MSARSLNWLKLGGLIGLAFLLGGFFAGLLDLPSATAAQGPDVRRAQATSSVAAPRRAGPIPGTQPLADLSEAFAAVAEEVRPSVVYIRAERRERVAQTPRLPRGFDPFFGLPQPRQRAPQRERGSGSGFIVSGDGYILTNHHVVEGADKVTVELLDHRQFDAKVVGSDQNTDVAVIKIDARDLQPLALGSSASARVGEWVLAIGNPLGENLTFTVTSGIISAKGRGRLNLPGAGDRSIQDFIQTDAAINPGNSGGPLVNVRGEVIGVNSAIASETGFNVGYGFAIPIDLARNVMDQLIRTGKVERAALGVRVNDATALDARYVGLPEVRGVKIENFSSENSPARRAGLEVGDVIVSIDGQPVEYVAQLQQIVGFRRPGETARVEVARKGGVRRTFTVRLISATEEPARAAGEDGADSGASREEAVEPAGATVSGLGVTIAPLGADVARELELPAGTRGLLVQSVNDGGPSADKLYGTESGSPDVILSVEGTAVRTEAELRAALRQAGPGGIVTLIVYNRAFRNSGGRRVVRVELAN